MGRMIQCFANCGRANPIKNVCMVLVVVEAGVLLARLWPELCVRRIIYGPFIVAECVCSQT